MRKRFDEFASYHFYETPEDLYRRTYFEAYDNVIQGIEKIFQQTHFLIYRNAQDICLNAINGKDNSQQLKVVCDVFKNDLNPTNLQVQLEQFANLYQDKPNCSINTLVEVLSTFGKNKSQKMLLQDVMKLARLFQKSDVSHTLLCTFFCGSIFPSWFKALIILQRATRKAHPGAYQCI